MNPPDRVRSDEWPTYFVDTALMDGLGVLALLLLGIGVLLWRLRRRPWSQRRPAAGRLAAGAAGAVQRVLDRRSSPAPLLAGHPVGHAGGRARPGLARCVRCARHVARHRALDRLDAGRCLALLGGRRAIVALDSAPVGHAGRARKPSAAARWPAPMDRCWRSTPARGGPTPVCGEAFVNVPADLPPLAAQLPDAGRRHAGRGVPRRADRHLRPRDAAADRPQRQRRLVPGRSARALRHQLGRLERAAGQLAGEPRGRQPAAASTTCATWSDPAR